MHSGESWVHQCQRKVLVAIEWWVAHLELEQEDHYVSPKPTLTKETNKCGKGYTEEKASGKITGGTSTYTKKGETFTAYVCVGAELKLAPGTRATF